MPKKTNFIQIFDGGRKVIVPIIQRDYAQGRTDEHATKVREKFLQALYDAVTDKPITLDFIYGDIDKENVVTLLDGQQRITTLFLLYWYAAKRSKAPLESYEFLKRFSYETRPSSTLFCEHLVEYQFDPSSPTILSVGIEDQNWFPLGWKKDPTIRAMLTMLDAIDAKFRDVDDLWDKLSSDCITFYFLPIKDMGLTDELYIKMNSRGKPLSEFENFKAELEGELEKTDRNRAKSIAMKIDGIWTDLLWHYKGEDNTIDDEFLRCFGLICQIICYRDGETLNGVNIDCFGLLHRFFNYRTEHVEKNIDTLESFFDAWADIAKNQPLKSFFEQYVTFVSAEGKARISSRAYNGNIDLFGDAVSGNKYTLTKLSMFYAFTNYAKHRKDIAEADFRRRIRIINNLIQNSPDEISDNEKRVGGNRMPAILRQIDSILLKGRINREEALSFNAYQLEEEVSKLWFTNAHPELAESLYKLEDHDLLQGQIGIVGVENTDLFPRFTDLFQCSRDKVNRALMATGDYAQKEKRYYSQYQLGSSAEDNSWRILFHHGSNENYDQTQNVLAKLLNNNKHFSDEVLDKIADEFLADCEKAKQYDWRYYYVKYSAFRPNDYYGKYFSAGGYDALVITTKSRCSESAYSPYLKAVQESVEKYLYLEYFESRKNILSDQNRFYRFEGNNICLYEKKPDAEDDYYGNDSYLLKEEIPIEHNIDSIDTEDRIEKLVDLITNPQPK